MNGKILIPPSSNPIVPPSPGYLILWVAQDGTFKSMDADGNIKNLANTAIEDLIDVSVTTPVEGEVFTYDATLERWVNKPIDLGDINLSSIENDVNTNATNISSVVAAITALSTDLDNAEQNILSNTSNINTNTVSISDIESSLSTNTQAISDNTDDISSNTTTINSNTSKINANEGVINFNTDELRNIQNNLIPGVEDNVSALQTTVGEVQESVDLVETALGIVDSAVQIVDAATDLNTAEISAIKGDIATLENEIDALNPSNPISPTDPVDPSSLIDENDVIQAEAVDGFLKVNNRLKFSGASIRIGEGSGESDNPDGTGGEIAIGTNACFGNAAKTNGIGLGIQALYNVSGSANIGIGLNAGNGNSGNYNISLGNSAGQYRILSSSNVNIGYASGYNGRGSDNIYLGAWCGAVPTSNSIIENKKLRIGTKGGATAEYLDKELIIGNMDPDVDGGQWLLVNGNLRIKSPNGNQWAIKVDDSGNLSTEAVS